MWKGSSSWVEEAWALGSASGESPSTGDAAMQRQRALSTVWTGWDIRWRYTDTPIGSSIDLLINPSEVSSQPFAFIQMQIYCYDPDDFHRLDDAVREGGRIAALAVLFEVGWPVNLQPEVSDQTDPPLWLINGISERDLVSIKLTLCPADQPGRQQEHQSCYGCCQHCQQVW